MATQIALMKICYNNLTNEICYNFRSELIQLLRGEDLPADLCRNESTWWGCGCGLCPATGFDALRPADRYGGQDSVAINQHHVHVLVVRLSGILHLLRAGR